MARDATTVRMRALAGPRRVILAEDDDEVRSAMIAILEDDGFTVSSARNGHQLVRLLEQARDAGRFPDLLITDHRMPGFTGLEVATVLRENDWPVPVIVITAFARDLGAGDEQKVDVVFQKPFDVDDFRTAILYCLETRLGHYGNRGG